MQQYSQRLTLTTSSRNRTLVSEHALLDQPVALCIAYSENTVPRIPLIAVAVVHMFLHVDNFDHTESGVV